MRSRKRRLARWDAAVESYLANRHAFGRYYAGEEWILGSLRKYLVATGAADLNQRHFDGWRKTFRHLNPNTRRGREMAIDAFCRYRRRSEPKCFSPDPLSFARGRPYRPPVIMEPEQIRQLLQLASRSRPHPESPLLPFVARLAIVLLYTAGLRRGEVARLRLEDVDLRSGVLRIRETKFHESLGTTVSERLHRAQVLPEASSYNSLRHLPDISAAL